MTSVCSWVRADWTPEALQSTVAALIESQGLAYTTARDAVLARGSADVDSIRAYLTRPGSSEAERTLDVILRTRAVNAAAAQEYDATFVRCVQEDKRSQSGRLMCDFPKYESSDWVLPVEFIWKRNDFAGTGWQGQMSDHLRPSSMNVDAALVLFQNQPTISCWFAGRVAEIPGAASDARVYPALVQLYNHGRPFSSQFGRNVMLGTSNLGTPQALDALHQMERIERARAVQRGQSPWTDNGEAEAANRQALRQQSEERNTRHATPELRAQRLAAADENVRLKEDAWLTVMLWRDFDRGYQNLRDRGVPAERALPSP
jgi:hypothetical protein